MQLFALSPIWVNQLPKNIPTDQLKKITALKAFSFAVFVLV